MRPSSEDSAVGLTWWSTSIDILYVHIELDGFQMKKVILSSTGDFVFISFKVKIIVFGKHVVQT